MKHKSDGKQPNYSKDMKMLINPVDQGVSTFLLNNEILHDVIDNYGK